MSLSSSLVNASRCAFVPLVECLGVSKERPEQERTEYEHAKRRSTTD